MRKPLFWRVSPKTGKTDGDERGRGGVENGKLRWQWSNERPHCARQRVSDFVVGRKCVLRRVHKAKITAQKAKNKKNFFEKHDIEEVNRL